MKINSIENLIEVIKNNHFSDNEISNLTSKTIGKTFILFKGIDAKCLFWLQNYANKYHYLENEKEKPPFINSNIPFSVKDIFIKSAESAENT
jgi:hypothetical protein